MAEDTIFVQKYKNKFEKVQDLHKNCTKLCKTLLAVVYKRTVSSNIFAKPASQPQSKTGRLDEIAPAGAMMMADEQVQSARVTSQPAAEEVKADEADDIRESPDAVRDHRPGSV